MVEASIQRDIVEMAMRGESVVDVVRFIRNATGTTGAGEGRLVVIAYMKRTFDIPLREAASFGAWVGFDDGDGSVSDDQLDAIFRGYLQTPRGSE